MAELLVLVGRATEDDLGVQPARPSIAAHPLAVEVGRMLADDSPLRDEDQQVLATLIDRVIDPYRKTMRRRRSA